MSPTQSDICLYIKLQSTPVGVGSSPTPDRIATVYVVFFEGLIFADNLSGKIFAFKFLLMAYLNTNCSIPYSLLMEIFED